MRGRASPPCSLQARGSMARSVGSLPHAPVLPPAHMHAIVHVQITHTMHLRFVYAPHLSAVNRRACSVCNLSCTSSYAPHFPASLYRYLPHATHARALPSGGLAYYLVIPFALHHNLIATQLHPSYRLPQVRF